MATRSRKTYTLQKITLSCVVFLGLYAVTAAAGEPILPTTDGTTWEYGIAHQPNSPGEAAVVTVRISGTEERGAQSLVAVETRAGAALTNTDLIAVDETGVHRYERTIAGKNAIIFKPPQTLVPAPLKVGDTWELDDRAAATEMHQRWTVAAEEVVDVPAGNYHAFRLRCEQPWPISVTIDRWFAPGFGFVKDVTTTRGPTGRLLSRTTMVLKKLGVTARPPEPTSTPQPPAPPPAASPSDSAAASPEPNASPSDSPTPSEPPKVRLEVSSEREGEPRTDFASDTPNIFVQWAGEGLPIDATVRVDWVAEDVGDIAPPNFVVDETSTTITRSDFAARFTLSRPRDGWAAGKYRIDLYVEDDLVQSLKVTIHD